MSDGVLKVMCLLGMTYSAIQAQAVESYMLALLSGVAAAAYVIVDSTSK